MGEHSIQSKQSKKERQSFLHNLLKDLKALEFMLKNDLFEKGIQRIGAEQEFCLVDDNYCPSDKGPDILKEIDHPQFTTELAKFNLEINLNPYELTKDCFSLLEAELNETLDLAHSAAHNHKNKVLLTGILPTISPAELSLDYMTPNPRYFLLGDVIRDIRGSDFELHIQGIDELIIRHDNILFEACNTSFQIHLQIRPEDFVDQYNWAQAISGPILSVCSNSPMLFGRELWSETRIALFQQSIDTRDKDTGIRERQARVYFGKDWIRNSILDIYEDDISRFPLLLSIEVDDSMEALNNGQIPKLKALAMHNGTIWKWNRPCYGVGGGKPHLRIENRYIPSGPSVEDEMANMALWIGVMKAMPAEYKNMWEKLEFEEARENFHKAAKSGLGIGITWEGKSYSASQFALEKLIPWAKDGLTACGVDKADIDRLLGVIENRVKTRQTGTKWMVKNYRSVKRDLDREDALVTLTASMYQRSTSGKVVSQWSDIDPADQEKYIRNYTRVDQVMTNEIFTVQADDLIELVEHIMRWRNIRHVPVEDSSGNLIGLVSNRALQAFQDEMDKQQITVEEFMTKNIITVQPSMSIKDAMELMLKEKIGCLPIVKNEKLIGLITDTDMTRIWEKLRK